MSPLLQKALMAGGSRASRRNQVTIEHAELVEAWTRGSLTDTQCAAALDVTRAGAPAAMASLLKACVVKGLIEVRRNGSNGKGAS